MKSFIKKVTAMPVIIGIQILATALFLYFVFKLNLVPMKYIIAIVAAVVILLGVLILLYRAGNKKQTRTNMISKRVVGTKVVSLIISVVLMLSSSFIARGDNFINNISDANENTYVVGVYVKKEKKVESLDELKGKNFGVSYKHDTQILTEAIANFEEQIGIQKYTKVDDYVQLADELYDGKVDAIIVGLEYLSMLEGNHENFEAETTLVATYEVTKKAKSTTIRTNVTENPFTVYITGIDSYGKVSTVSRSDVNLIVTVNPKEKQILMVSIPRDTEITLHSKKAMDKLTHTGIFGHEETINTIQDFLDVQINYYARTNFSGIIDIVDALGGVTIDSPHEFTTMHGNYHIEKGINEMDGDKALCFVRERYDLPNGDFDRGRNQQLLLKALLDRAMSPKIITNFSNILSAIEGTFETDMSSEEIRSLLSMQINDMSSWDVYNVQIDGIQYKTDKTYSMWGTEIWVTEPNKKTVKKVKGLIDKVENGETLTDKDVEGLQ